MLQLLNRISKRNILIYVILVVLCLGSMLFVFNNARFYGKPIAKVTSSKLLQMKSEQDSYGNKDKLFTQRLTAVMQNGKDKGRTIILENTYSLAQASDQKYNPGNELFVIIDKKSLGKKILTGDITNVKRDYYIVIVGWIFILVLLLVGKRQGLLSAASLFINGALLAYAIDLNVRTNTNLLLICGVIAVLFTVISLLFSNGWNEKTFAAIIATLIGTVMSLTITFLIMRLTGEKGMYYEEMQFLTRPYRLVFFAGLLIGSLGAVMDVAITMSASIFELFELNNEISIEALKRSALEIGRDIMGTMTSILFFAYISGAIPSLILYLKNANPLGFTLSMNLSLELTRALAGGIGIVLAIPVGLYTSIFFIKRKKARI
ncbi:YibE/F family protein [Aciduricibacillus chroicocephali]|uniref:YibE/F family protein n=1 Tax=Aciduricibacillus chroicocephali TaxID=3054939 RepID=A0ABY9KW46_9BACI|nr:YibE/F family protein [Bacillaceae bacterium 44XB]